jgi:hypothetical protein
VYAALAWLTGFGVGLRLRRDRLAAGGLMVAWLLVGPWPGC